MRDSRTVFIGWDSSQEIAYDVLCWSIRRHSVKGRLRIVPLKLRELKELHGFHRTWDARQSTEFTYTRFLVPFLCGYKGKALFMDCDMLALGDVGDLFDLDMAPYALRVVKHDHHPTEGTKMGALGRPQSAYPRKNWSSLMLMDCAKLQCWTKDAAETKSGAWLHRFKPIPDEMIGEINGDVWNVLDRHDDRTKLMHLTEGGPWLEGCEKHPYGELWFRYRDAMRAEEAAPRE